MKKQHEHNIDELFDKAFSDFKSEPSEQVWEDIRKQLPSKTNVIKGFRFTKFWYVMFSAALIIVVFSTVLYFYYDNYKPSDITAVNNIKINKKTLNEISSENKIQKNINANAAAIIDADNLKNIRQNSSGTNNTNNKSKFLNEKNIYPVKEKTVENKTVVNNIKSQKSELPSIKNENVNTDNNKIINDTKNENVVDFSSANSNKNNIIIENSVKPEHGNNDSIKTSINESVPEKINKISTLKVEYLPVNSSTYINKNTINTYTDQQKKNKTHFYPRIYAGIHYTPELIYNLPKYDSPVKYKENHFSQSAQISINYDYKNIIFQSGVGYSFYNNEAANGIKYISRDSVGYYLGVVSFSVVTQGQDSVQIIYNTTIKNIYDSIHHVEYKFSKNNYNYIQIPFTIGYRKYIKRFSFTVRGGIGLGILSYKKENEIIFNKASSSLLSIEKYAPALTKTYWQLLFSLGCGYQLTDNINLALEPSFKYYTSPFYIKENAKTHPYSIGLKTGFYLHF